MVFTWLCSYQSKSQTSQAKRYDSYLLQAGKIRYLEPFLESFFYFWTYLYHSWSIAVSIVSFNRQLWQFYIFRCLSSKRWFSLSCTFRLRPLINCWLSLIETSLSQLDSEWWRSWAFRNYKNGNWYAKFIKMNRIQFKIIFVIKLP